MTGKAEDLMTRPPFYALKALAMCISSSAACVLHSRIMRIEISQRCLHQRLFCMALCAQRRYDIDDGSYLLQPVSLLLPLRSMIETSKQMMRSETVSASKDETLMMVKSSPRRSTQWKSKE